MHRPPEQSAPDLNQLREDLAVGLQKITDFRRRKGNCGYSEQETKQFAKMHNNLKSTQVKLLNLMHDDFTSYKALVRNYRENQEPKNLANQDEYQFKVLMDKFASVLGDLEEHNKRTFNKDLTRSDNLKYDELYEEVHQREKQLKELLGKHDHLYKYFLSPAQRARMNNPLLQSKLVDLEGYSNVKTDSHNYLESLQKQKIIGSYKIFSDGFEVITNHNKVLTFNTKEHKIFSNDDSQQTFDTAARVALEAGYKGFDMESLSLNNDLDELYKAYSAGKKLKGTQGFGAYNISNSLAIEFDDRFRQENSGIRPKKIG